MCAMSHILTVSGLKFTSIKLLCIKARTDETLYRKCLLTQHIDSSLGVKLSSFSSALTAVQMSIIHLHVINAQRSIWEQLEAHVLTQGRGFSHSFYSHRLHVYISSAALHIQCHVWDTPMCYSICTEERSYKTNNSCETWKSLWCTQVWKLK